MFLSVHCLKKPQLPPKKYPNKKQAKKPQNQTTKKTHPKPDFATKFHFDTSGYLHIYAYSFAYWHLPATLQHTILKTYSLNSLATNRHTKTHKTRHAYYFHSSLPSFKLKILNNRAYSAFIQGAILDKKSPTNRNSVAWAVNQQSIAWVVLKTGQMPEQEDIVKFVKEEFEELSLVDSYSIIS